MPVLNRGLHSAYTRRINLAGVDIQKYLTNSPHTWLTLVNLMYSLTV